MAEKKERERLVTPIGIACFAHVWEAYAIEEGKEKKFSIVLVFKDGKDAIKQLRQKCIAAADAKFGSDPEKGWRKLHKKGKFRMPWRDASDYEEYGEPFDIEDAVFCSFQSNSPPGVVDKRAKPIMNRDDFYSGCEARVTYAVWPYDSNGNKGVTLLLNNVQKTGEGIRLSGKPAAEDDFDAVGGGDEDDDEDMDI